MIIEKHKNKRTWKYDTETRLYFNEQSEKWVKNPRKNSAN